MAKLTHEDILAYLEEATILELNDLVSSALPLLLRLPLHRLLKLQKLQDRAKLQLR